jgi:hypothetical protein
MLQTSLNRIWSVTASDDSSFVRVFQAVRSKKLHGKTLMSISVKK